MDIEEVKETFEFMDEWEDRYRFIIDLGRKLPEFDESDQNGRKPCSWLHQQSMDGVHKTG